MTQHFETVNLKAEGTDEAQIALVETNNIIIVEDTTRLQEAVATQQAAIAAGRKLVALSATAIEDVLQLLKREKRNRNYAIFCLIIALILVISFGISMGEWRSNANQLQSEVMELRDELQSDVFYTQYDELVDACLSDDYSVCYDVGITIALDNPLYGDSSGAIVSLAKNPQNSDECLVSSEYMCTVRRYTYSSSSSNNCRAAEYEINNECESILMDSYDSCLLYEFMAVANGGSYYSASENCRVDDVSTALVNGDQVSCNDCAVVIKLERVIQNTQNLF